MKTPAELRAWAIARRYSRLSNDAAIADEALRIAKAIEFYHARNELSTAYAYSVMVNNLGICKPEHHDLWCLYVNLCDAEKETLRQASIFNKIKAWFK